MTHKDRLKPYLQSVSCITTSPQSGAIAFDWLESCITCEGFYICHDA